MNTFVAELNNYGYIGITSEAANLVLDGHFKVQM